LGAGLTPAVKLFVLAEAGFDGFAQCAAAMFHREQNIVVDKFADGKAGARESDRVVRGGAAIAIELDAVPPSGRMVSGGAQIEDEFEAEHGARDESARRAGGALVGVVDDDDGVVGEMGKCESEAVVLIAKGVAAVVEVGADATRAPWRGGKKFAEVEVVEGDLAGRGAGVEGASERGRSAVELREIVAGENSRIGIAGGGADDARPFVASHFNVNFALIERGYRGVEERELVFGGHAGNFAEDVRERAIGRMARAREAGGVVELGPQKAASRHECVKVHMQ
jgi:hypothetical protein